jgi:plasmid stability protein
MKTLHVRNVPDELYERIRQLAQAQQRLLGAQVIRLLERAVAEESHESSRPSY